MISSIRQLRRKVLPPRSISAAVLLICLLSSLGPFTASSSAHKCSMPCCATGSCTTGACETELTPKAKKPESEPEPEPESHCADGDHGESKIEVVEVAHHASAEVIETTHHQSTEVADELCGADNLVKTSSAKLVKPETAKPTTRSVNAMGQDCPTDCCAKAVRQLRRSGDTAVPIHGHSGRPPTFASLSKDSSNPTFLNQRWRRQSPPRAPPFS